MDLRRTLARHLSPTRLATLGLVLLTLYTSWELATDEGFVAVSVDRNRHVPDYWFERMTLTNMNPAGQPKNRIHAARMTHFRDDGAAELLDPHYESYKDTRPPLLIASPTAWMNPDGDIVLMQGAVHIQRDAYDARSWLRIDTHELWLFSEQDYAQTDYLAVIRTDDLIKRGVGLEAWLEEDRFKLHAEVKNRHERKKSPPVPADLFGTDAVFDEPGPFDG